MTGGVQSEVAVALRIARVNHACQPNAGTSYDEIARVAILFAQKDIQPGEEISICYYSPFFSFNFTPFPDMNPDLNIEEEFNFVKNKILSFIYGVTCSADCSCHDPAFRALFEEGRQLDKTFNDLANQLKIEEALVAGEKLLDIHRRFNISWIYLGVANYNLFRVAFMKSECLPRAKEYIRSAVELFRNICPYSVEYTKQMEKLLEHPGSDRDYMLVDKMHQEPNLMGQLFSRLNL